MLDPRQCAKLTTEGGKDQNEDWKKRLGVTDSEHRLGEWWKLTCAEHLLCARHSPSALHS